MPPNTTRENIWNFYHRTDELFAKLAEILMASRGVCVLHSGRLGRHRGTVPLQMLSIRTQRFPRLLLKSRRRDDRIVKVMIVANEHGRELITSEVALELLNQLCNRSNSLQRNNHVDPRVEYIVVPIVNTWGRRRVENGSWCKRLNERGVDINRNYGYRWGEKDDTSLEEEERPGGYKFSERQTREIVELVRGWRPHVFVSLHSGDEALVMPWDSGGGRVPGSRGQTLARILGNIRDQSCPKCKVGTSKELFGYSAFGTGVDHMTAVEKVPFAFTAEVYGTNETECFDLFNPRTKESYKGAIKSWSETMQAIGYGVSREVTEQNLDEERIAQEGNVFLGETGHLTYSGFRAPILSGWTSLGLLVAAICICFVAMPRRVRKYLKFRRNNSKANV